MNVPQPSVWIVVPCYNEADRLSADSFLNFIDAHGEIGFCFVNDGSRDATAEMLKRLAESRPGRLVALDLPANSGKAEAVRQGVNHVLEQRAPRLVGYWDADLATPLSEIPRFLALLERRSEIRFLAGSRVRRMGAHVKRKTIRHVMGRVFATSASLMLGMPAYDTQCGAKIIESGLAREIFREPFISRWIFDVELLMRTRRLVGLEAAIAGTLEIPLEHWEEVGESKVRPIHFLRAPLELWRIRNAYRNGAK